MSDNSLSSLIFEGGVDPMSEGGTGQNLYESRVIAQLFGFSGTRRIEQLTQDGVIDAIVVTVDGHKVRRYELVPTVQKYISYLSDKAYGKSGRTEKELELREQKLQADIALKESQGELHRLKTDIAAGKYISVEEVQMDYSKFFVTFKKFALSIPARIVGMFSGQLEPAEARKVEKEMASEVNRLLDTFVIAGIVSRKDVENGSRKKKDSDTKV